VIITKQLVQKVDRSVRDKSLVLWRNEFAPRLAGISAENLVILHIQLQVVLFQIRKKLVGTKYASNLDQLVVVVVTMEEWLLAEDLFEKCVRPVRTYIIQLSSTRILE